ncbi:MULTISPECIES: hypothetical protein [Paraburkholderia]|uniref:Uncharacterized protein n=1 Tax=Paraburkholderia podalyriae TaxID=1938811 RepID=A0ABR7Q206_9BURK|nr:hypothetical protein [Paraburkholderia podalyriae]MBC8752585.1 hypothetical protein [Paraburkholderia podalyriae]
METLNPNDNEFGRKLALTHTEKRLADLLAYVLTDAMTEIEVASRDLQISDSSFVRLRRAMGRVACAQSLLETMRAGSVGAGDEETALRVLRVRAAVELLARESGRRTIQPGRSSGFCCDKPNCEDGRSRIVP